MAEQNERVYDAAACVSFRKTTEAFGGLSNMAPGFRVRVNGILFLTVEALYQACRFPHLPDLQAFIIGQTSPMTLKMRIKKFRDQSRPDWPSVRVSIMRWCLRVKLSQNLEQFGRLLLETGDKPIVEDSRKDTFWGAIRANDGSFRGENVLGRLLMELREELKAFGAAKFKVVQPADIPHLRLLGRAVQMSDALATQDLRSQGETKSYIPQKNAAFKLSKRHIDARLSKSLADLLEWVARSGLDVDAKLELTTKGGLSEDALRELTDLLDKLGLENRSTVSFQTSLNL